MKLGIIYNDGKIINHRSLFKVIFNPILRFFGYQYGTVLKDGKLRGMKIMTCDRQPIKWKKYDVEYDYILRKRYII